MMVKAIQATKDGVRIQIHAQPGAKKTETAGAHGDAVKIRIHAPPVEGKANEELIRFLAETFSISRTRITLVSGEKSRAKTFAITDVDVSTAVKLLLGP